MLQCLLTLLNRHIYFCYCVQINLLLGLIYCCIIVFAFTATLLFTRLLDTSIVNTTDMESRQVIFCLPLHTTNIIYYHIVVLLLFSLCSINCNYYFLILLKTNFVMLISTIIIFCLIAALFYNFITYCFHIMIKLMTVMMMYKITPDAYDFNQYKFIYFT